MYSVDPNLVQKIKESGLFDEHWYLERYDDVSRNGLDAVYHYLWIGARMGRHPSPTFDPNAYLIANPDVAAAGLLPFVHYVTVGHSENRSLSPTSIGDKSSRFDAKGISQVPPPHRAARVISFYLPQFHRFAENDSWWGEGFTEWTNVKPAKPQFIGHYQPHVPHGDLGYYDLSDNSVFKKQINLALNHGVSGFCFYYYWFGGKRLMEKALESYLSDSSLDFPFCLCWANENWTRRWDGLESEVLIAQQHSPEDDVACISDLARFMRDQRYIRINGKPLLLVYRPSLLPDPVATTARWRNWCRENGIGEIFIAYTQSFERVDPAEYGFDAAVEFPPNNTGPTEITSDVIPMSDDFGGKVFDWNSLAERSKTFEQASYKLFRGVCPGWDNTARRKNHGSILVNNDPCKYELWLKNAVREAVLVSTHPDERIIFVNAWNEWAEGAHLEPDQKDGYAYLEATRRAVDIREDRPKVAIVIHAYYPDVLKEIVKLTERIKFSPVLYVTTPLENYSLIREILDLQSNPFHLLVTENRGRDVLPFIQVLNYLRDSNFEYVAKVHTKKSLHRGDGDSWRNELYEAVIGYDNLVRSIIGLQNDPKLGAVGPRGHLVSMDTYLGSNLDRVEMYAAKLGIDKARLLQYGFFAGTMFMARLDALQPILELGLTREQFEVEAGQIDGTMAHVVERLIGLAIASKGYRLGFTCDPFGDAEINNCYGYA